METLDPQALQARLSTTWLGRRQIHLPTCSSTNDVATAEARAGAPEGTLVTTDLQTAGRGRLGRSWHATPGETLTFSIVLRPARPSPEIPPLTLLAGGALAGALGEMGFDARVKWPNDVLLRPDGRPRKVAGILTEAATVGAEIGHVIVGIGLNVNTQTFPDDLADKATSLRLVRGERLSPIDVLATVLATLEIAVDDFRARGPDAAIALWNARADTELRCTANIGGREVEGVTAGVLPDGSLRLRDDSGVIHRIVSGEIVSAG